MKNLLTLFLLALFLFSSNLCCYSKQSLNTFTINIQDVPQNIPKKDNGLSDGVIAAIALGSTFGGLGILTGIGYYFYKNSKELQSGLTCGQKCPYRTIDCKSFSELLASKKKYTYLMKASEKVVLNSKYHYLIIPDTEIKGKTFNTVFFELPQSNSSNTNFRIIQASTSYSTEKNIPNLDSNIFINPKEKNTKKMPTYTKELSPNKGFLIKQGTIQKHDNNILAITTQNLENKNQHIYAIIVEFWSES